MFIGTCVNIMIILILGIIFNIYYITLNISLLSNLITKEIKDDLKKIKDKEIEEDKEKSLKDKLIKLVNDIKENDIPIEQL